MGAWPTDPSWVDLENINKGNEYNAGDGVTYGDLNGMMTNLLYLSNHGGERIPFISIDCQNQNYELTIELNVAYKITNCAQLSIRAPSESTHYLTHLFISFSSSVSPEVTRILNYSTLPEYGDSLSQMQPGDEVELSIDNQGGIVCFRKK